MQLKLVVWNKYESGNKTKNKIRLVYTDGILTNVEDIDRIMTLRNSGEDWRWSKFLIRTLK